ncbi:MAG: cation:proton antiporter [Patescibacteria group bacterium]|nr:cation:proton antiporter [Patescibacteria group bacterium]
MDFAQIAIVIVIAAAFGFIAKTIKQPLLVGYLIAGIVVGAFGIINNTKDLKTLSQVGVTLLLFLLGLEMKLSELPTIGKPALVTGIGQIVFTSIIGYFLALILGFDKLPALYIAVALTFSSTIIMVKLLSEKKDLQSLYGRIAVGFLLVQDFVAILILLFLAGISNGNADLWTIFYTLVKAFFLFGLVWFLSKKIIPAIFEKYLTSSTELLFITSIAWALGFSSLVAGPLGFTLEVGGFLAGLALSNLPEHLQVATRAKPLRDFFLTIFFVVLGTELAMEGEFVSILPQALIFSVFVLIGNPIIVLILLGIMGYKKRTSFMAGLTVAQISEFSLILMAIGLSLSHVAQADVSLVIVVAVITMTLSTYMIMSSEKIYLKLQNLLSFFERAKYNQAEKFTKLSDELKDHFVIVGCDRSGHVILSKLLKSHEKYVVVDFNPKIFDELSKKGVNILFGDISDPEILEAANVVGAKVIITTFGVLTDNLRILEYLKMKKSKAIFIAIAANKHDAKRLYDEGAYYVVIPEMLAGFYLKAIFRNRRFDIKKLNSLRSVAFA